MLPQLPREILTYILSLVVHDYFSTVYVIASKNVEINIAWMTTDDSFICNYLRSNMSTLMRKLSLTHSKFRHILLKYSIKKYNLRENAFMWGFDERFFYTLSENTVLMLKK